MDTWIRFEESRGRRDLEYGTITKDGRLVIANDMAVATGLLPGTFVEMYYQPDSRKIGIKPVPCRSPYTLKVTHTGMVDNDFTKPNKRGSLPQAIISVKGFLSSRHIGLTSKIRGNLYWEPLVGMLVFEIPHEPKLVCPSEHAGAQLENKSWPDRVVGDLGEPHA